MHRWDVINRLAIANGYNDYLEIGVRDGGCFEKIVCRNKEAVDPKPIMRANFYTRYKMTSDEFFAQNVDRYDLIFIDGLHLEHQVIADIANSLNCLRPKGAIVCHDMNPAIEHHQREDYDGGVWNGTCWKAWAYFRQNPDLSMYVVDTDYGCGVIQFGQQEPYDVPQDLDFAYLKAHRKELLNLIPVESFLKKVKI